MFKTGAGLPFEEEEAGDAEVMCLRLCLWFISADLLGCASGYASFLPLRVIACLVRSIIQEIDRGPNFIVLGRRPV